MPFGCIFHEGLATKEHWSEVVSFVQDFGGVEYALAKAKIFGEKAKGYLKNTNPSPEREALCTAADYVMMRVDSFP